MTHLKFSRKPFETTLNSFVDDLFGEMPVLFKSSNGNNQQQMKGFASVNIKENEKSYILDVIAPGFEKADFKVNLDQNILTISVEKNSDIHRNQIKEDSDSYRNEKQIRKEYSYQAFKRSFTLDEKINAANIDAKYVNGVLTLNLPKKEEVKTASKEISIQ